jgi:aldehyde dehydrogenase (NAD+)
MDRKRNLAKTRVASSNPVFRSKGNSGMGNYHGHLRLPGVTNARGVLYHGAMLDPGFKYPPYSEHQRMHGIIAKLMP